MFLDGKELAVERGIIFDVTEHEGAELLLHDGRAAVARLGGLYKCAFAEPTDLIDYAARLGISGELCLTNMPKNAPELLGFEADACKSFAWLGGLPPTCACGGADIRKLAPTLAETLLGHYSCRGGSYTVEDMRKIMLAHAVLGALDDGKLAGFIGRHSDGSMGMLTVLDGFRRRGFGEALECAMITLVMLEGRVPICDVYEDNAPSVALQKKLGMTEARGYTFWTHTDRVRALCGK